ncbi:Gfo/Idh/MocA family protein [Amorphus orientalis]|uniref:D-galactose 1-dehydrogenase n=1 Tax=Amorphus orientalis TaxID=649198 RepID=A0AAE3VKT2_9HYPH|nr:Gfo/Idh/MocA family oxidoreductase [Amorphus orientalis]MDQ0313763.1 D-galactose 1-dehydrogenase [Amorphus orientalis]
MTTRAPGDTLRIGIAGFGKIARDQHVPAIAGCERTTLAAVADPAGGLDGTPSFASLDDMLREADIDAVAVCTPPQIRHDVALAALAAGKHVLLEKPPGATLGEVDILSRTAERAGLTLFATWHSRHAPGVEPARAWIAGRKLRAVRVTWKEDVRRWHPGQAWIFEPGGLGVFDPGINAFSILTRILPAPLRVTEATFRTPENRTAPIAADVRFAAADGVVVDAALDFRQEGPQTWEIDVEADDGRLVLSAGGAELAIDGGAISLPPEGEYADIYTRFADLVATGQSDVDPTPFGLVADAFLMARTETVDAFHDPAEAGKR